MPSVVNNGASLKTAGRGKHLGCAPPSPVLVRVPIHRQHTKFLQCSYNLQEPHKPHKP